MVDNQLATPAFKISLKAWKSKRNLNFASFKDDKSLTVKAIGVEAI